MNLHDVVYWIGATLCCACGVLVVAYIWFLVLDFVITKGTKIFNAFETTLSYALNRKRIDEWLSKYPEHDLRGKILKPKDNGEK